MALKIRFVDKTEVAYLNAVETEEYWNGASRRTLTFDIAREAVGLDALDNLCTEDNCKKLELINEEADITNIYEGYILKLQLGVKRVDEGEGYVERIGLKLGKRTFIEEQLHKLGLL